MVKTLMAGIALFSVLSMIGCSGGEPAPQAGDAEVAKGIEQTNPPAKDLRDKSQGAPQAPATDLRGQ